MDIDGDKFVTGLLSFVYLYVQMAYGRDLWSACYIR